MTTTNKCLQNHCTTEKTENYVEEKEEDDDVSRKYDKEKWGRGRKCQLTVVARIFSEISVLTSVKC